MSQFKSEQREEYAQISMPLLSVEDVAHATGLHRRTIYRAIEDGELVAFRLRGRLRIAVEERDAWLAHHVVEARPRTANPIDATRRRSARGRGRLRALMGES